MAWPEDMFAADSSLLEGDPFLDWISGATPPVTQTPAASSAQVDPQPPLAVAPPPVQAPEPAPAGQLQPGIGVPAAALDVAGAALPQIQSEVSTASAPFEGELPAALPSPVQTDPNFSADAISGGELPPDRRAPGMPDELLSEDEGANRLTLLDQTDPVGAADARTKLDMAREDFRAAEIAKAAKAHRDQAELDFAASQQARQHAMTETQAILRESRALASRAVDNDRWWSSRSLGQKLAGIVAVIAGGLGAGGSGGRNVGMEMLQKEMDRDIEKQRADIENARGGLVQRKGLVADLFQQTGDLERAAATARAAAWDRAVLDIDQRAKQFDPRGTAARRLADARAEAIARKGAALQAHADASWKKQTDIIKIKQEQQKIDEERRKNVAAEQAARAKAASAAGGGLENTVLTPEQMRLLYPGNPIPPIAMKGKDYAHWLTSIGKGSEIGKTSYELGAEGRKAELERGGLPLFDDKGARIEFIPKGSGPTVDELRKKSAAYTEIVNLMDEAKSVRTGWSSDIGNSDEKQRLQTIMGKLKLRAKDAEELGVLTPTDVGLIEGMIGTADFSRFRDFEAGLDQARSNLVGSLRTQLVGAGMEPSKAAEFAIPNPYKNKAKRTPGDDALANVLADKTGEGGAWAELGASTDDLIKNRDANYVRFIESGRIFPSQKAAIDEWAAIIHPTDGKPVDAAARDKAVERLGEAARNATMPGVREYATKVLERGISQSRWSEEP